MISGVSCSELPIHSARFRLSTSTPNGTYCTLNAENILPPVSSATEMCRERNGESRGAIFSSFSRVTTTTWSLAPNLSVIARSCSSDAVQAGFDEWKNSTYVRPGGGGFPAPEPCRNLHLGYAFAEGDVLRLGRRNGECQGQE